MKKILAFTLLLISIFSLSACSENPFKSPVGTEFVESDTLTLNYYNGQNAQILFEYTFSKEYYFFIDSFGANYRFTTINNYSEISKEFIDFLEYYNEYIEYDRYLNNGYADELKLSLGATEDDYNLTKISVDDDVYDVDAFISVENGLRVIFSYTEFYHDDELIIIPYHLSILSYDIHEAYLKEYLAIDNEYVSEKAILTKYITHVIPLPPKVGVWPSSFDYKDNDLLDLGHYLRIIEDTEDNSVHTEVVCTEEITEACFEKDFSTLTGFVYNYTINQVISFYEINYGGKYDGDSFIFFSDGLSYKISLAESNINFDNDDEATTSENVITFEITKYNE